MPHTISPFESSTVLEDNDNIGNHHFFEGIPRENRTNKARLAERAMLQGAKSGLLEDRVVVDGVEETF